MPVTSAQRVIESGGQYVVSLLQTTCAFVLIDNKSKSDKLKKKLVIVFNFLNLFQKYKKNNEYLK